MGFLRPLPVCLVAVALQHPLALVRRRLMHLRIRLRYIAVGIKKKCLIADALHPPVALVRRHVVCVKGFCYMFPLVLCVVFA